MKIPRRWRSAASRWPSSAISAARAGSCAARRARSARTRPWPARGARSRRPRSGWRRAISIPRPPRSTARGARWSAAYAELVAVRRLLLLGCLRDAEVLLSERDWTAAPPRLAAIAELARADLALRQPRAREARLALERARIAAWRAGIPMLAAEVEQAMGALAAPAARSITNGVERTLDLAAVEQILSSPDVVVDACRRSVRRGDDRRPLATRPILFALVRALAEAWPADVPREALIAGAFGARRPNDSHRARLRVEIARLRRELRGLVDVRATPRGFVLVPAGRAVVVLAPPLEALDSALLALLADGEAWSTSALALALGASQRTVQRALAALEEQGRARSWGRARARRWLAAPLPGITTALLLPVALSAD